MMKRRTRQRKPLRLVTILVISFVVVVLIALGLAGALAVPFLTSNQQAYNSARSEERLRCEVPIVEQQLVKYWTQAVLPNATGKATVKPSATCNDGIVANPFVPPNGNATTEQIEDFLRNGLVRDQRVVLFVAWLPSAEGQPPTPPWVYFDSQNNPDTNLDKHELNIPDLAATEQSSLVKNKIKLADYIEQVNVVGRALRGKTGDFEQGGQKYRYIVGTAIGGAPSGCLRNDMNTRMTLPIKGNGCHLLLPPDLPRGFQENQMIPVTFFMLLDPISNSGDFVGNQIPALLGAGAIALLVAIVLATILARVIARPLAHIARGTEAIAAGDLSYRVPEKGNYEAAQLAGSFNRMVDEVAESQRVQRELIGNVSHELKTPLTAIRGFSQAMTDGILKRPEDFAGPAQIINNETERMIRLVNTLLDLSKLEGGQVVLAHDPVDMADVLALVGKNLQPKADAQGISLQRSLVAVPPVTGDLDRMLQIMTNLADNALKYSGRGSNVRLTCGLRRVGDTSAPVTPSTPAADGGSPPQQTTATHSSKRAAKSAPKAPQFNRPMPDAATFSIGTITTAYVVWVEVADTGQGISLRDLPHIFERFYQAEKSRSKVVGGVGLGLAITRELIVAQNGAVSVQSQVGEGTTFRVEFPVSAEAQVLLADPRRPFPYDRYYHPFSESLILSDDTKKADS